MIDKRLAQLIAYVFIACAAAYGITTYTNRARDDQVDTLRSAEARACERLQFVRDNANATSVLIYQTFKDVIRTQSVAVKSGTLKGVQLKQAQDALKRSQHIVSVTTVIPPTDCREATERPDTYKSPLPEPIVSNTPGVRAAIERSERISERK